MSAHLTHEELTDNLLGVSSLTVNAHLLNCPACASELQHMKHSIAAFRDAAHAWSESAVAADRTASVMGALPERFWRSFHWASPNWALALTAMLFAVGITFYLRNHQVRGQDHSAPVTASVATVITTQSQIEQDNELLSQVNREIAEAVPAPMQPLQLSQSVGSNVSTAKWVTGRK
jgi:anti-sigma factor RsiW